MRVEPSSKLDDRRCQSARLPQMMSITVPNLDGGRYGVDKYSERIVVKSVSRRMGVGQAKAGTPVAVYRC